MNIQLFGDFDENLAIYNKGIVDTKNEMANIENEKNTLLNDYNLNYQNQLTEHENLMNQQQAYIDKWAETEKENQQKQTDYNVNLINQNKAEAQKQTDSELGDAYIDYQRGLNQFGGNAEAMATNGLAGTGFAKNTDIAMNITYQNRVSTAKAALKKANTDYDNQIQQALLNNDASLAEIALQQMQQSYQLALQGFEYKTNLQNNKLAYEQSINDSYFNRSQTLQSRIDNYNDRISNINQMQVEIDENRKKQEQAYQQWLKEFEEEKRQYNKNFNATYNSDINSGGFTDTTSNNLPITADDQYTYAKSVFGNDTNTVNKKDYYFDNGYQPQYVNNKKLSKVGVKVKEVFGNSLGSQIGNQNIWSAGKKYYYWDGKTRDYVEIDGEALNKLKKSQTWWDKIWHTDVK